MARFRVTAFPTIFLLRDGNTYVYSGARNVASVSKRGRDCEGSPLLGGASSREWQGVGWGGGGYGMEDWGPVLGGGEG